MTLPVGRGVPKPYYQDDAVTIYHGDCQSAISGLMGGVDLVIADPPYGVGFAEWDAIVPDFGWLHAARNCGLVLVMPGNRNQWSYPRPDWCLSWARPGSVQRADGGGFSHWDPVLVYGKNTFDVDCKVFEPSSDGQMIGHPCQKPMRLLRWLVSGSKTTGIVLDPFMGSGTTLRAAKDLGRKAIGIEIEERYCEIAAKRCAQEVLL